MNFYYRMKKKIIYSFLIFLAIILQTSFFPNVCRDCESGDIVMMLVLAGVVLDGFFGFFWWAIFAGIIYDLASFVQIGTHALIFLLVIYFVSFFSRRFSVELKGVGVFLFLIFVVFATLVSRGIIALSIALDSQSFHQFQDVFLGSFSTVGFQIFFNAVLFFLCFHVLKKIKVFFDIE